MMEPERVLRIFNLISKRRALRRILHFAYGAAAFDQFATQDLYKKAGLKSRQFLDYYTISAMGIWYTGHLSRPPHKRRAKGTLNDGIIAALQLLYHQTHGKCQ
jgi:hypothetical protein